MVAGRGERGEFGVGRRGMAANCAASCGGSAPCCHPPLLFSAAVARVPRCSLRGPACKGRERRLSEGKVAPACPGQWVARPTMWVLRARSGPQRSSRNERAQCTPLLPKTSCCCYPRLISMRHPIAGRAAASPPTKRRLQTRAPRFAGLLGLRNVSQMSTNVAGPSQTQLSEEEGRQDRQEFAHLGPPQPLSRNQ